MKSCSRKFFKHSTNKTIHKKHDSSEEIIEKFHENNDQVYVALHCPHVYCLFIYVFWLGCCK